MQDLAKAHFKVYRHPDQTGIWKRFFGGRKTGEPRENPSEQG